MLTTLFTEGFEGAFPGGWMLTTTGANRAAQWGDSYAGAAGGAWSGFCADNGNNARPTYDNNLRTAMQRTGVSLAGYDSASLSFSYRLNTEPNYDFFEVRVADQSGAWTTLLRQSGNSGGWRTQTLNLDRYAGQSGLVISFEFSSDGSVAPAAPAGVWVDNIALEAAAAAAADPDPDDQISQASPIAVGATLTGQAISPGGDVDLFRFTASAGQRMTFDVDLPSGSRLDSYLRLFDSSGRQLAYNDDAAGAAPESNNLESYLAYTFTSAGTYYLGVSAYPNGRYDPVRGTGDAAGSTGAYTLTITGAAATGDADDQIAEARIVTVGAGVSDTISPGTEGDVDMYRVTVSAGQRLGFDVDLPSGSRLDSYLRLFDSGGRQLAFNDDAAGPAPEYGSLESYLTYTFSTAGTYYLGVSAYGNRSYNAATGTGDAARSTGAYTLSVTTLDDAPAPLGTGFHVELTLDGFTAGQQAVFEQAAARWEQVITGDLPDALYSGRVVDDLLINASAVTIDGAGGILGQSTATDFRAGSGLPYRGFMQFDTADLAAMQADGTLAGVIVHEMGHVLGIGVIWDDLGLLSGAGTSNPRFTGPQATAEYDRLFGVSETGVPVEAGGGAGTRLSHWRESVFDNELMTGWVNGSASLPLSRVTVASLADLGYQVNLNAADDYTPPQSVSRVAGARAASSAAAIRALYADAAVRSLQRASEPDDLWVAAARRGAKRTIDPAAYELNLGRV